MTTKEFLKTSLVQKGGFIEAQGHPKSCPGTRRRDWFYAMELGEVPAGQRKFPVRFSCAKEDSQDSGSLATVKGRWFSL